jgi:cobalt-zinc-cadmium efflux system membrane fusion protein
MIKSSSVAVALLVTCAFFIALSVAATDDHAGHDHATGAEKEPKAFGLIAADEHAGHGHDEAIDPTAFCGEHQMFEREDALCNPGLITALQPGDGLQVRLAAADVAEKAGITVSLPQKMTTADGVMFTGRSEFNRNRLARLTAVTGGVVRTAAGMVGQRVRKGELLAEIASPEASALRGQLGAALAHQAQIEAAWQREQDLYARGISSRLEFQQAKADQLAAHSEVEQLREQAMSFGVAEKGATLARLRAPLSGVIVDKLVGTGDVVSAGAPLFTIADPEALWVELAVPESRIAQVQVGATVEASFSGLPDHLFHGRILQVGAALDERSRTLMAVAEIANPGGLLKAGMFGQVKLHTAAAGEALVVPMSAVQSIDQVNYVFVRREAGLFELRRVETGAKQQGLVTIVHGLKGDEPVVIAQGFALKSEVLKARLGASCADH